MFETGKRRVLTVDQVKVSNQPVRVGGAARNNAPEDSADANVSEIRDAHGRISEIHVQCKCGCETVVECEYTDGPLPQ